jgi:CheY-like chemotaxis protein
VSVDPCDNCHAAGCSNFFKEPFAMNDVPFPSLGTQLNEPSYDADVASLCSSGSKLRVMVIDDNKDVADMFGMFLDSLGHYAVVKYDAYSTLADVSQHAPHVLFIDIGMPEIDGYGLVQRLRLLPELTSSTFVAVSGFCGLEARYRAFSAGFHRHLTKPCSLEIISAVLDERMTLGS